METATAPMNRFEALWAAHGSEGIAALPAERVLQTLGLLAQAGSDVLERIGAILRSILEVTRAERIFFFDVAGRTPEDARVPGNCIASLNIDLEPIRDPEGKVPTSLLRKVLETGAAILITDLQSDPRASSLEGSARAISRGLGAVPLFSRGRPVGIVYFDHRFQPISIGDAASVELAVLCHALGFLHHAERLEGENRSLWQDVSRLKERSFQPVPSEGPRPAPRLRPDRSHLKGDYNLIVGQSQPMMEIFQLLDRISGSNAPILINGESGTGKELIANAIHGNSPRNGKPFISENCGALTETLLESELFGYVKGAFTGAGKDHKGLFEQADSGSLFLDEVGDMSPSMQKKLLRAIQEGVIRRVGGKDYIKVDVRIICATNKDLLQECRAGKFREDLYYRLNVINIKVPGLRERKEDIPELVAHFLGDLERQFGAPKAIEQAAMQRLLQYSWPGNIRELQNEVKRLYALSEGTIRVTDLSDSILQGDGREFLHPGLEKELADLTLREATEKLEKELIRMALISARGNKSMVAKKLQIPKTSLYNKISKYQLDKDME